MSGRTSASGTPGGHSQMPATHRCASERSTGSPSAFRTSHRSGAGGPCARHSAAMGRRTASLRTCGTRRPPRSQAATPAIDDWPLERDGFDLLRPGLRRAYARARKTFRSARKKRSDEALHEWRKRSKDLWYALRIVRRAWPAVLGATADEAHELSDRLGDDHDLAVLNADLDEVGAQLTAEQREQLRELAGQASSRAAGRGVRLRGTACWPRSQNGSSPGSSATGGH